MDDVSAGVKSTALLFGDKTRPVLGGFSALFATGLTGSAILATPSLGSPAWILSNPSISMLTASAADHPFFMLSILGALAHLGWQIGTVRLDSREDCWSKFSSNQYLGLFVWLGLMADYVLSQSDGDRVRERPDPQ